MPLLAGADEIVVGAVERGDHVAETRRVAVGKLCRGDALLLRRLQHLDAVLVGAGKEEHVHALQTAEARERVRRDGLIGMADVRHIVRIGDGCGDVIGAGHGGHGIALAARPGKRRSEFA